MGTCRGCRTSASIGRNFCRRDLVHENAAALPRSPAILVRSDGMGTVCGAHHSCRDYFLAKQESRKRKWIYWWLHATRTRRTRFDRFSDLASPSAICARMRFPRYTKAENRSKKMRHSKQSPFPSIFRGSLSQMIRDWKSMRLVARLEYFRRVTRATRQAINKTSKSYWARLHESSRGRSDQRASVALLRSREKANCSGHSKELSREQ